MMGASTRGPNSFRGWGGFQGKEGAVDIGKCSQEGAKEPDGELVYVKLRQLEIPPELVGVKLDGWGSDLQKQPLRLICGLYLLGPAGKQ